ncbi:MAG TPA: sialidase family protein [Sphingobium sp.]|nr:sialidase family protein [Sphingobium sp.]
MTDDGSAEQGDLNMTRRAALVSGSALGTMLVPGVAQAAGAIGSIRRYEPPRKITKAEHKVIFYDKNWYTGWTYVIGFWDMKDGELIQSVFSVPSDYSSPDSVDQDKIPRNLGRQLTFRSKDYGRTWSGPEVNAMSKVDPGWANAKELSDLGPINYLDPNVIVSNGSRGLFGGAKSQATMRVSRDRGRTWSPTFMVPLDGLPNHSGMNSFLVRPDGTAMLWLIESGPEGWNRHPLVFACPPGGTDFHFMAMITDLSDPKGAADSGDRSTTLRFGAHRWFYPRAWMLQSGRILCSLRCQRNPMGVMWTEIYASDDGGTSWNFLSRLNDFGAPASLVVMPDGRVVAVYGYRLMPAGIRCKVSDDDGATWGPELIIRDDGGSWDLGYPNAWLTDDGRVGTIYWFNSKDDPIQVNGGVRHIQSTIFSID